MSVARPPSIRSQLERSLLIALAAGFMAVGVGLYAFVRYTLLSQLDAALTAKARTIAAAAKIEDSGHFEFDFESEAMREFEAGANAEYFQLWATDPQVPEPIAGSASLLGSRLAAPPEAAEPMIESVRLPDGRRGRIVWLPFTPHPETAMVASPASAADSAVRTNTMLLAVARSRGDVDRALAALAAGLAASGVLLCAWGAVAVRRSLRRGLGPLDDLSRSVAAVRPTALPERLDLPALPPEIEPVRTRIDELLTGLREAFERERRFTGAAAHELRTPLAELRSLLEVRLRWPESREACEVSLREAHTIGVAMERGVGLMLALARAQLRTEGGGLERIDPGPLVRAACDRLGAAAPPGPALTAAIPAGLWCRADPAAVTSIATNLIRNALEYTPAGGLVHVTLGAQDAGGVRLEVCNGPVSLSPGDIPRLFEPYWRKDAARSAGDAEGRHLGIGLTLVAALAQAMGGVVDARLAADGTLAISVELPDRA